MRPDRSQSPNSGSTTLQPEGVARTHDVPCAFEPFERATVRARLGEAEARERLVAREADGSVGDRGDEPLLGRCHRAPRRWISPATSRIASARQADHVSLSAVPPAAVRWNR